MGGLVRRPLVGVLVAFMSIAVLPFMNGGIASAVNPATATVTTPYLASVAMAATPTGHGYWLVGLDGGVFSFGDAPYLGSLPGLHIAVKNIVAIDPTPDGHGYWLAGADGGVFAFGNAAFYGSVPGVLGRPAPNAITGLAETPDGHGYWLVGADGGVFSLATPSSMAPCPESVSSRRPCGSPNQTSSTPSWSTRGSFRSNPRPTDKATGWSAPMGASSPSVTPGSTGRFPASLEPGSCRAPLTPAPSGRGQW